MNPTSGLPTSIVLLSFLLGPQASKPASDSATTLSRAKIALESGDFPRAEALLEEASAAAEPAVSAEARRRLSDLKGKLGKAAAQRPGAESPIAVRVRDAVQKLEREPSLWKETLEEIAWIGEAAVPFLGERIEDSTLATATRDALVQAAAQIGGEASLALLDRIAGSSDDLLRRRAMEEFGERLSKGSNAFPKPRWTAVASRFLEDRDSRTRQLALKALARSPEAIQARVAALAADPDALVRATLVQHYFPTLAGATKDALLADADPRVRSAMASMLERSEWTDSRAIALRLLKDADPKIRSQALMSLYRTNSPEPFDKAATLAALSSLVADPGIEVRRDLPGVARQLLGPASVPLILPLLLDEQGDVAKHAVDELGRMPRGALRREDLPKALELASSVVTRHGFGTTEGGTRRVTVADNYVNFLARMVSTFGRKGDFSLVAGTLAAMPGVADACLGATETLLDVATPADVPALCGLFDRDPSSSMRLAALRVLERKVADLPWDAEEVVTTTLARALAPETPVDLRERALLVAVKVGSPKLGPAIEEALQSFPRAVDDWRRIRVDLASMAKKAAKEAAACLTTYAIRELPQHATDSEQRDAVGDLARLPKEISLPALVRILEEAASEDVRRSVIERVPASWGEDATRFLLERAIAHPGERFRSSAIQRLAHLRAFRPEVVAKVAEAASDPTPAVRSEVLEYLKGWNAPEAVPLVRKLLADPEAYIRLTACQALGSLLSKDAVPDLLAALADESEKVREAAKGAVERIRFYFEEKRRWEEWYAGRGSDPGEGIRKLLEMLDDEAPAIRLAAIESLGTMKAKEALPRLVELVKKGVSKGEREAAAKAVERINRE